MDNFDTKIFHSFPGKVARKDLTNLLKKGANVPTYVLEYLLGMYCTSEDDQLVEQGLQSIKKVLNENYVKPEQSDLVKSKIRENGKYTVIDRVVVTFDERADAYVARFTNLNIAPFKVYSDLVRYNEKLLLGGIWCIVTIGYSSLSSQEEDEQEQDIVDDLFGTRKFKKKKKKAKDKYESPFNIISLKPIQMSKLKINDIIEQRKNFTKDEWIDLLLRSCGYEPSVLTERQKFHYLLRLVPLIQKNYNLVELGPRSTGKSHIYSEISPHSILISGGFTTTANLFYNMGSKKIGLVGNWDCIAFDEIAGMDNANMETIQTLKNYMANGSFARGTESINADASICLEGNIFSSVEDMMKRSTLFDPFPELYKNDSAFFDRIHAYLPGWEAPKLRASNFTSGIGLISDCLSEFCHAMRNFDFTDLYRDYFTLNRQFNTRDDVAVSKTFSGLMKLIYPDRNITKEQTEELLQYCIEYRRRVKEQLNKMTAVEFRDVNLGYIDNETNEEHIVYLPEQPKSSLIFEGLEVPGYVYGVGKSVKNVVAVYRLENNGFKGSGKMESKNIEGVDFNNPVKKSITAAFNYFTENAQRIIRGKVSDYDYSLYFNDLQGKGISSEVSVAEVVGLCSVFASKPVLPALAIVGRVVMSGSMMPLSTFLADIVVPAKAAGAKRILLPDESREEFEKLSPDIKDSIEPLFYETPIEAAIIALGIR